MQHLIKGLNEHVKAFNGGSIAREMNCSQEHVTEPEVTTLPMMAERGFFCLFHRNGWQRCVFLCLLQPGHSEELSRCVFHSPITKTENFEEVNKYGCLWI